MPGIQVQIRDKVVTLIQAVPHTGQVYPHTKYNSNWDAWRTTFTGVDANGGNRIIGWWLTQPTLREGDTDTFDSHTHIYEYIIHAVMSFTDGGDSDALFSDMIWSVFDKLHVQGTLGFTRPPLTNADDAVVDGSVDVSVPLVQLRMFGSYLCHYAELRFRIWVDSPVNWVSP